MSVSGEAEAGDKPPLDRKSEDRAQAPAEADKLKLLQPFLDSEPGQNPSRPSSGAPLGGAMSSEHSANLDHEKVDLAYGNGEVLTEQLQNMSLNQGRATMVKVRQDLRDRGYSPSSRFLGYGTETENPNNPFTNPDRLYQPSQRLIDFVSQREAREKDELVFTDIFASARQAEEQSRNPFGSLLNPERKTTPRGLSAREEAIRLGLTPATDEEQSQYQRRLAIERSVRVDPDLRDPFTLQIRLKPELTPGQQQVYAEQQELQHILRVGDFVAHQTDKLQAEYDRNHWQDDSHWFGVDDGKFLAEVASRNPYNVSDYDKFRVLAVIDRTKAENPAVFGTDDITQLNPEQQKMRIEIDRQEHDTRKQLAERMRFEVTKLEIALGNQQGRQGLVLNAADSLIGNVGTPGGWGGMFMDSDATSRTTRENIEKARQASERLLALSDFKGSNVEFATAYQERTGSLMRSLLQVDDNLIKMAENHQGRIEGISDISQITASTIAILSCAAAAPETFGGSLAAIPVVAPMAAGAAGKFIPKWLESQTSATGREYKAPEIVQDAVISSITSAPFLPGNRIAKPLLQAESAVIKEAVVQEGTQLALQTTKQSFIQRTAQAGRTFAQGLSELTPAKASELVIRQTAQSGKRALGYSAAGAVDGTITSSARALASGEDPIKAGGQGLVGGAVLGPVLGPAIKFIGHQAKRIGRQLDAARNTASTAGGAHAETRPAKTYRLDAAHPEANGPHRSDNRPELLPVPVPARSTNPPEVMLITRPSSSRIHDMTPGPDGPGGNQAPPPEDPPKPPAKSEEAKPGDSKEASQPKAVEPKPGTGREPNSGRANPERPATPLAGGEKEQNVIQRRLTKALDEVQGPSGKSLSEEGWQIVASDKNSPADHAHIDLALVNEKEGVYLIIDTTANNVVDATNPTALGQKPTAVTHPNDKVVYTKLHLNAIAKLNDVLKSSTDTLSTLMRNGTPISLRDHPLPPMTTLPTAAETRLAVRRYQDSLARSTDPSIKAFAKDLDVTLTALGHMNAGETAAVARANTLNNFKQSGAHQAATTNFATAAETALRLVVREQFKQRISAGLALAGGPKAQPAAAPSPSAGKSSATHTVAAVGNNGLRLTTQTGLEIDYKIDTARVKQILNDEWVKAIKMVKKEHEYILPRIQGQAMRDIESNLSRPETLGNVARSLTNQRTRDILGADFKDPFSN